MCPNTGPLTQNNLGLALWRLGEREQGTVRLEEAVTAYQAALTVRTQKHVPQHWAGTQTNLGLTLWTLGERKKMPPWYVRLWGSRSWPGKMCLSIGLPYDNATKVANIAKEVVASLKNNFFSTYEVCMAKHMETLKRIGLR